MSHLEKVPEEVDASALQRWPEQGPPVSLRPRKPYASPTVTLEGDVRGVLLGGSGGVGDSSNTTVQKPR